MLHVLSMCNSEFVSAESTFIIKWVTTIPVQLLFPAIRISVKLIHLENRDLCVVALLNTKNIYCRSSIFFSALLFLIMLMISIKYSK